MSAEIILVTGGCGYIGSHTILELIRHTSFEVISVDSFVNSHRDTLNRIENLTGKRIKNYEVDLCDETQVKNLFASYKGKIKGIIHFAALKSVPESTAQPLRYYQNNINSLLNVLKYGEENGVSSFIFSSSCSVYGNVDKLPVNESTPLNKAISPYAHTKQIGEDIIQNFVMTSKMKAILLRYFNPVGGDMSGKLGENPVSGEVNNLVPIITQKAAGLRKQMKVFGNDYDTRDGTCIRDYIHVTDISLAHVKALQYLIKKEKSDFRCDVFNLGSGNGVTVLEAIRAFEKISGIKLEYDMAPRREGDVAAIYSDSRKAKELLQWETQYGIDDMMSSAWKWQQYLNTSSSK